jgi:acetyl-CoA C-acetyltransferase
MQIHVVVAGWGQVTQPKEAESPRDVPGLMIQAARRAGQTLADPSLVSRLDGILVVRPLSAHCPDAPARVARALGADPGFTHLSDIGGNSPQTLINLAGSLIAENRLERVLVVGAEAYVKRNSGDSRPDSALLQGVPQDYAGDDAQGTLPLETRHGIRHPMHGFPLFETALWHASGLTLPEYLNRVGRMWSRFSRVAAGHPFAWSKTPKTAEEILTPSMKNRPIAFPYTKFMNAFITVDQAAAVILMSENAARKARKKDRAPVYFAGGGYARDRQRFMAQKTDFTACVSMKTVMDKALDRSGFTLDDMDCFDFYSCFPCAVSIAKKMAGLSDTDPRPLTLTGGLGFFGGPGNNYNLHAVATLAEQIAKERYRTGMVTALGWFMHKHAAGIYTSRRPEKSLAGTAGEDHADPLAGPAPVIVDESPSGTGIIETYTVVYHPDHTPAYGVIYGRTDQGNRFVANTVNDGEVFTALTGRNLVGTSVRLVHDSTANITTAYL